MPNRIIRTGILSSDRVDALSAEAEVFYRRLMSRADDYGRFDGDWRVLRSELYPLRNGTVTREQIENWLAECTKLLPAEQEPLILQYFVGRKRFLQITNFMQPLRSKSRWPSPGEGNLLAAASNLKASASNCVHCSDTDTDTDSHSDTDSDSNSGENSAKETPLAAAEIAVRKAFRVLAERYPEAGRTRLKRAFGLFHKALSQGHIPLEKLHAEMLAGLEHWQHSELWQAGKVHWIGNWLSERMWLERPLSAEKAAAARAGPATSKREKGLAEFRRLMVKELSEQEAKNA